MVNPLRSGLVSVSWLSQQLGRPSGLRVIDSSWFLPNSPFAAPDARRGRAEEADEAALRGATKAEGMGRGGAARRKGPRTRRGRPPPRPLFGRTQGCVSAAQPRAAHARDVDKARLRRYG